MFQDSLRIHGSAALKQAHLMKIQLYATFDGHAMGDMKTYIYKTTDLGRTWKSLSTPDLQGYAHKIKEDNENEKLLFLGTEFGLFVSIDGGEDWAQFTGKCSQCGNQGHSN